MLPSVERFSQEAHSQGLLVTQCDDFGQDYAKTVSLWLDQFDQRVHEIKALGFDDAFIQLWRYYLAYCYSGFKTGRIGLVQAVLEHA